MTNVTILGASGSIAKHVIDLLAKDDGINLTLLLRNKSHLRNNDVANCRILEADVLKYDQLKDAIKGQDIVYANLAGDLEAAADVIEASSLDSTILRPAWFTSSNETDYETTGKGKPEKGSVISQKSLATLITQIIKSPGKYSRENLGVNKPNS